VKHIACGEGGMITTNNRSFYERLLLLRTHGITRDINLFQNDMQWAAGNASEEIHEYPRWYMEMQELGFNYRLTDFQAALGISQLSRAGNGLKKRRNIAAKYLKAFEGQKWLKGQSGSIEGHGYHLYIVEVEDRLGLFNHLRTKNIFAQVHYIPTHMMPYYQEQGYKQGDYPYAETYYSRCLSLPMYPTLTTEEQDYVIESVRAFYNG
jgi:dTDP-4-amino-4,6-dideoxygalactose transaminase